ncbi:hypothetical protein KW791_02910 [Candidatus Parcubacteria bacterium]|nr:hypothetical protein [Candidatus Parcubacteria bacterium]
MNLKTDPLLHHVCKRIQLNTLEAVTEMFELLGMKVVYRPPNGVRWAMIAQEGLNFNIQLAEVRETPIEDASRKNGSHVAFISNNPTEVIQKVEDWAKTKNLQFRKGGWSERELWFDFPELFVDFVVEVMHTSILEE